MRNEKGPGIGDGHEGMATHAMEQYGSNINTGILGVTHAGHEYD